MNLSFMDPGELLAKALRGEKLFPDEAIHLCAEGDLPTMAAAARSMAGRVNPGGRVGYAIRQTVVYSNVCQPNCPFCSGTVMLGDSAAFTRTADQVVAEVKDAVARGVGEIVLQGGHRIDLPWEYYTGLLRAIRAQFPAVVLYAYSPTEIMVFNVLYQKRTAQVIGELAEAGMTALLAGGSEAMPTRAPEYLALLRGPWAEWFDVVHRCADVRIPVVAPFAFGFGETPRERVGHLYRVRAVQERTGQAGKPAIAALSVFSPSGAAPDEHLRMVALARVLVPGVPHVQSGVGAVEALQTGADELAVSLPATAAEVEGLIRAAGFAPYLRAGW